MTTISRSVRSVPFRSAQDTWSLIVDILSAGARDTDIRELKSVAGIAAALITEKSPQGAPIIVHGGGPRVRIYCLYDESAMTGDTENEQALQSDPLAGDWRVSLPCPASDLIWVTDALRQKTPRFEARDDTEGLKVAKEASDQISGLELNAREFLRP